MGNYPFYILIDVYCETISNLIRGREVLRCSMRLIELNIRNFRSIAELSLNNLQSLNCYIGPHNSGKTNILDAISIFWDPVIRSIAQEHYLKFNTRTSAPQDFDRNILSYLGSSDIIKGSFKFKFEENETLNSLSENLYLKSIFLETSSLYNTKYSIRNFINEVQDAIGSATLCGLKFDLYLNNETLSFTNQQCYLITRDGKDIPFQSEYIHIIQEVIGTSYIKRFRKISDENDKLRESLHTILKEKKYKEITAIEQFLKEVLDQEFVFELTENLTTPENQYEISVTIERAFSSPLWRVSSSTLRIISLAHLLTTSPVNQIIIIDDPGLYLHPRGERALAKKLIECSNNHQLFFSTHSTRLLIGFAYLVDLKSGWTRVRPIRGRNSMKKIVKLLGIRPSDSFGSDCVIFVEGQIDTRVYRVFERKLTPVEQLFVPRARTTYIGVGGWTNMQFVLSLELLRSKFVRSNAVAITDGDIVKSDKYMQIKRNWKSVFPDSTFFSLKEECIESIFLNHPIVFKRLGQKYGFNISLEELENYISKKRGIGIFDKTITSDIIEKFFEMNYRASFAEALAREFVRSEIPPYLVDIYTNVILKGE